jgi:ClpP class serine protease
MEVSGVPEPPTLPLMFTFFFSLRNSADKGIGWHIMSAVVFSCGMWQAKEGKLELAAPSTWTGPVGYIKGLTHFAAYMNGAPPF